MERAVNQPDEKKWQTLCELVKQGQSQLARDYAERNRYEHPRIEKFLLVTNAIREGLDRAVGC